MQAFNKIVYKSIPTTWLALFRKCSIAAKIALMRIKYFMPKAILAQSALFSKKMIGFSLMSLWCRLLKTCFHKDSSIKSLKEQNALIIFIFLSFWLWTIIQSIFKISTQDFASDPNCFQRTKTILLVTNMIFLYQQNYCTL